MSQNNNSQDQQDDNKVFARHVDVRDTKTGGSILNMFFSVDEATKLKADLEEALAMTSQGEAEGAKVTIVTGQGSNGKPYALAGVGPIYPRQQGQPAQQNQAPKANYNKGPGPKAGSKPAFNGNKNFKPRSL